MILYEHPFNERIRTWLRLERLFIYLGSLIQREELIDHHYALHTLFEIMDVSSRSDLKGEILGELDRQKQQLVSLRGNPAIADEGTLDKVINQLQACYDSLNQQVNLRTGAELTNNAWLMSVRNRMSIPGGTCEFDLPAYHAWLHYPAKERLANLYAWVAELAPMADAITNLLQLLRDSGVLQKALATQGKFELPLPAGKTFQLLRILIDERMGLIPEVSANRLLISLHWFRQDASWKLVHAKEDIEFEFAICA